MKYNLRKGLFLLMAILCVGWVQAQTTVSDLTELRNAIAGTETIITLKNNIEVTDGNGNVSSSEINMKSKYLSYNTYIVDFEQPNNTLMMDYGTLCRISSEGIQSLRDSNIVDKEIVTTDSDVRDKIGGMIGIYDIYFNNESVFSQNMELRLTIQPSAEQTISSDNWQYIVNIKNGVIQSQIAGGECSNTNSAKLLN